MEHLLKTYDYMTTSIVSGGVLPLVGGLVLAFLFKVAISKHVQYYEERMNGLDKLMTEYYTNVKEEMMTIRAELNAENKRILSVLNEIQSTLNTQSLSRNVVSCAAPPPPPPLPPPAPPLMITPVSSLICNKREEKKKKSVVDGPPQLQLTKEDISNMLKKLKKTANKQKLLSDSNQNRTTPPRRTLFKNRTPRRSRNLTSTGEAVVNEKHK